MIRAIVTGGAGFIGSHVVRRLLATDRYMVLNADALTYAGNLETTSDFDGNSNYAFALTDISDASQVGRIFSEWKPDVVFHLAAESHVDRSIDGPADFIKSNILGTFNLLQASRKMLQEADASLREKFRFVHVSTDEVFGSLGETGFFTECSAYDPRSPYSASKASADHLVRAWFHTFGLPCVITNCSNNYGPFQFPEKLIPVVVNKAIGGEPIPVYGDGGNVRDWLFVSDHANAIVLAAEKGKLGETYVVGTNCEKSNLEIVRDICRIVDDVLGRSGEAKTERLITFVKDRPGHDRRYAIDATKIRTQLGWEPHETYSDALEKTVRWYVANQSWCTNVLGGQNSIKRKGVLS